MKKKTNGFIFLVTMSMFLLAACGGGSTSKEEKKEITVGTSPGPYSELFLEGIVPVLESKGFTVKDVDFTDLRSADVALDEGAVDVNVDQHTAYMDNFNKETSAKLVAITPIPTVPTGLYSDSHASTDDVKKGAKVGIPQDASNAARALLLLQKAGWITLDDSLEPLQTTTSDIIENPHDLKIIEMDSAQIPRSLPDLDFGVVPGSMLYAAGMSSNDSLLNEDILPQLILQAVVSEENKDTEWAKAIIEAYKSDEFLAHMDKVNSDNYWYIPEELTK